MKGPGFFSPGLVACPAVLCPSEGHGRAEVAAASIVEEMGKVVSSLMSPWLGSPVLHREADRDGRPERPQGTGPSPHTRIVPPWVWASPCCGCDEPGWLGQLHLKLGWTAKALVIGVDVRVCWSAPSCPIPWGSPSLPPSASLWPREPLRRAGLQPVHRQCSSWGRGAGARYQPVPAPAVESWEAQGRGPAAGSHVPTELSFCPCLYPILAPE